jgi:hypothetical protein
MKAMPDVSQRLSETQVCEINGVSQQYRQSLVKRELVQAAGKGCTLPDALELAVIKAFNDALPTSDATLATRQMKEVLADLIPGERLDAIYDRQYKRLAIARTDGDLRALVAHGRPVSVIPLSDRMAAVGDAFRRLLAAGSAGSGSKRPTESRQGKTAPQAKGR